MGIIFCISMIACCLISGCTLSGEISSESPNNNLAFSPTNTSNIDISSTQDDVKFSINAIILTPDSIDVRGTATLPDGTNLQTQLFESGNPVSWWPSDKIIQVQNGKWIIFISFNNDSAPDIPYISSNNILKVWIKDNPTITADLLFGLIPP